jgi:MerR family transcriptional regulator, copper efflux regulator
MRVGDAARQVGTSARMLRYAEQLGLVAPARTAGGYRDYGERDLLAAADALRLQARYRVTPAALAFGLRALHDPEVAGSLHRLAALTRGRRGPGNPEGVPRSIGPPGPATALDFETAKARRLLRLAS